MLKKNLVRSGFLSHGLLFLFPNATTLKIQPRYSVKDTVVISQMAAVHNDTLSVRADTVEAIEAPSIQLNKNVTRFVSGFLKKEDEFLQKMKDRSPSYFRVIHGVFHQYGIPLELKYLAIVESQLRTTATSRVGAKGLWQFMPVTARELGLKVSGKTDERTHFYKSTVAAAKYLKSLHNEFGDWLLVLAAYNGGPGTVYKAIKKSGSRNFWVLQRYLPEESRGHVKRFIGIHYFFEGTGSVVTQTKSEALAYQKLMEAHLESVKIRQAEKDTVPTMALAMELK